MAASANKMMLLKSTARIVGRRREPVHRQHLSQWTTRYHSTLLSHRAPTFLSAFPTTTALLQTSSKSPSPLSYYHLHQSKHQVFQRQHRRSYIFFPSDLAELRYRWKLFWERNNTPTKIRVRLRDRYQSSKRRLRGRYQVNKLYLSKRYQTSRQTWRNRYQASRLNLQQRYQERKRQYQERKSQYRSDWQSARLQFQQRRREFTQRWSARRRDLVQDSTDLVKGYLWKTRLRTRVFTLEEYAKPSWFDVIDGRPLTSRDPTGRFVNPWHSWSTNGVHSVANVLAWRYQRALRLWQERGWRSFLPQDLSQLMFGNVIETNSNNNNDENNREGAVTSPNTSLKTNVPSKLQETNPAEIDFTWIGHSTCLVRMGHATLLTDPIFSHRCTPFHRLPGIGVARDVPPSLTVDDLPDVIDVCLISHDHYDHLDLPSCQLLKARVNHWVVPLGCAEWLETRCSIDPSTVTELEWWQSVHLVQSSPQGGLWQIVNTDSIFTSIPLSSINQNTMSITCCPAQHWSSRTFFDRCKRLWCSFAVETQTQSEAPVEQASPIVQKFFFAGDTGMPRNGFPLFQQIGDFCGRGMYHRYPKPKTQQQTTVTTTSDDPSIHQPSTPFHPFDLAALPIGAYDPDFLMQDAHMNPAEAVACAQQLQARKSVAIHWGTFALSEEPMDEPPQKLQKALSKSFQHTDAADATASSTDFVTLQIGESLAVPALPASDTAVDNEEQIMDSNSVLYDEDDDDDVASSTG